MPEISADDEVGAGDRGDGNMNGTGEIRPADGSCIDLGPGKLEGFLVGGNSFHMRARHLLENGSNRCRCVCRFVRRKLGDEKGTVASIDSVEEPLRGFRKLVDGQIVVEVTPEGKCTAIVLYQNGMELRAKKIE